MSENDAVWEKAQAASGEVHGKDEDVREPEAASARAGPGVLSAPVVSHSEQTPGEGAPILASGDASWAIDQADAVAFLSRLGTGSVDLVVTDPPYESLEKHRAVGTTTRLSHSKSSSNDWFTVFPNVRFRELFDQVHRVLVKNAHFYLFCDQETAFVAKPIGEAAGFKFWKPIIWDKCLAPETLVWTTAGVRPVGELAPGDRVVTPDGRDVAVLATRRTQAPVVRLSLSDRTHLVCSAEHRLLDVHGAEVEARSLTPGDRLKVAPLHQEASEVSAGELVLDELIDEDERVLELPDPSACLFCGRQFDDVRAAAAHQARFCEHARSKAAMADAIGVAPKRLRRWMSDGRLPARWAQALGLEAMATGRSRLRLQNDSALWFPERIVLDHGWGRLVGLYAAEGWRNENIAHFAFHAEEKHLHRHIARLARSLGLKATVAATSEAGCVVSVGSRLFSTLLGAFVGGAGAGTKHFLPRTLRAPGAFLRGVFDGLIEGDGQWSHEEQRETFMSASPDLATFVLRFARELGWNASLSRFENDHLGGWRVRFDPATRCRSLDVVSVEHGATTELVDLAIDDPRQLYVLANGVVSHNCKIGMGYHYRSRYEMILFFEKGKRRLNDLGIADVIRENRIYRGYPTEKPVRVNQILIEQSTSPGQLVVDPFMGTASAGLAALSTGRHFLGSDVSDKAIDIATERLTATGAKRTELPEAVTEGQLPLGIE